MTRNEVLEVVRQKTLHILEKCPPEAFSEEKTLVELGADSLDLVEILSACTRELRVKIPRTQLAHIQNISAFVDILLELKQASSGPSPTA